ncbi:50S ribosomal protein L13 [Candidatus Bilamarchaeum dharawalense]|uniref:Large ribosomal subunit protein uL13 n=1 Tax=Candidatus Bilamarchaeum dharawalense TaxID=2885759 RepID=A0A5E4LU28_9ARCH|nr:50S ribosomal protein L13 [Candidatus Bilamarchaeum dharawalense]
MQVINGENMIFGRLASQIAKRLIKGEEVHLINAEKLVIVGNPEQITQRYLTKRGIRHKGTPERSPVWPKVPHLLVKRMVRGMLPMKSSRGKTALGKLRVHTGNPKRLEVNTNIENATFDGVSKHVTIYEICKSIGYSG